MFALPAIWWFLYHDFMQTYSFWKYGVEKQGTIISLDHTVSRKGGTTYFYTLRIGDDTLVKSFGQRLPVGISTQVIVLSPHPRKDEEVTIGTKRNGLFDLFYYVSGGTVSIYFVLLFGIFMPLSLPSMIKEELTAD